MEPTPIVGDSPKEIDGNVQPQDGPEPKWIGEVAGLIRSWMNSQCARMLKLFALERTRTFHGTGGPLGPELTVGPGHSSGRKRAVSQKASVFG